MRHHCIHCAVHVMYQFCRIEDREVKIKNLIPTFI
nr:MAG TPA: hypothetical protein [Caudoviricetes sp.]